MSNVRRYNFLETVNKYNPDISLINETKLNARHKISFENYAILRDDRTGNRGDGGAALLIKKKIEHFRVNIQEVTLQKT